MEDARQQGAGEGEGMSHSWLAGKCLSSCSEQLAGWTLPPAPGARISPQTLLRHSLVLPSRPPALIPEDLNCHSSGTDWQPVRVNHLHCAAHLAKLFVCRHSLLSSQQPPEAGVPPCFLNCQKGSTETQSWSDLSTAIRLGLQGLSSFLCPSWLAGR